MTSSRARAQPTGAPHATRPSRPSSSRRRKRLVELAAPAPGERVLDLADRNRQRRAGGGAAWCAGDRRRLRRAPAGGRPLAGRRGGAGDRVRLGRRCSTRRVPAGSHDLALSSFGVIFTSDPERVLEAIARALRPGGRALLTAWLPQGPIHADLEVFAQAVAEATGRPAPERFPWHEPDAVAGLAAARGAEVLAHEERLRITASSPQEYLELGERDHPLSAAPPGDAATGGHLCDHLRARAGGAPRGERGPRRVPRAQPVPGDRADGASGREHDLAELAPVGEAVVGLGGPLEREGVGDRHLASRPRSKSGNTSRSSSRAASAFSSSARARSVEPWIRARLPISASRLSSALAPAPTPITAIRPPVSSASRLSGMFGAPTSSRITSKGPCSANPSQAIGRAPSSATASRSSSRRTVAVTSAPAARPSWIAAVPTPPAPPCTSRRSPIPSPACVKSASWAVVKTSGRPPAGDPGQRLGHRHQLRARGTTASSAWAPPPTIAITRVAGREASGALAEGRYLSRQLHPGDVLG